MGECHSVQEVKELLEECTDLFTLEYSELSHTENIQLAVQRVLST